MKSKIRRRTNQRNQVLLEAPALSRHFVHFVTEIPPDMQPAAPPRRDCGSLPLLPPACPAWRNAGGGPPALNYSVTNILCTFPHQPMPPTQAGPRRGITNSLSININNSCQTIFGSIYSINIQIRLSSVCHTVASI